MKKVIVILCVSIVLILGILFVSTGGARTDVFLHNFSISEDGKVMTLNVGVTSSAGYIRKMEQTSGSMNPYLTFYSTFGINSKIGANDTYQIDLDENMDEVYFYKGDRGYVKVLQKDKEIGEWQIIRNNEKIDLSSNENMTLDDKVANALLTKNKGRYAIGECTGEGHIILGTKENENETIVYTLTMYGEYGFQDDNFVKVSGSGVIPAVITFPNNEEVKIEYPLDGSAYVDSIKEMFPEEYHNRVLSIKSEDNEELKRQETTYAKDYLTKIGRTAKIGNYGDFEHTLLTSEGVSVDVSNKLAEKAYASYPFWIGSEEKIEDGVRYLYEMKLDKKINQIILSKYVCDTSEVVERIRINSLTGEENTLVKALAPTGFAGSSNNRVELYKNGEVYWIQFDAAGFDYENIIGNVQVASNAEDIQMFEEEGINIIGKEVKLLDGLNVGWIVSNSH